MIIEKTSAGPAFCDAAVPVRTKMPVPMMDPMPSAVRLSGPSDRRSTLRSASACSASRDFFENAPMDPDSFRPAAAGVLDGANGWDVLSGRVSAQLGAVGRGRQAGVLLEATREVALIAEPRRDRD